MMHPSSYHTSNTKLVLEQYALPPFQNKGYFVENPWVLRSSFTLLAQNYVHCIALTKLGMLRNSLKATRPFIAIDI
jgi:hypothetical protein